MPKKSKKKIVKQPKSYTEISIDYMVKSVKLLQDILKELKRKP